MPLIVNDDVMMKRTITTSLGNMIAIADDTHLHFLEFADRKNLDLQLKKIKCHTLEGNNEVIESIQSELLEYFSGDLKIFKTPMKTYGTQFQQSIMQTLTNIPFGETRSYKQQAESIGNPRAVRAVARANSVNQIAIAIPCHRVIGSDGSLTGYAGGLERKEWLLNHERKHS